MVRLVSQNVLEFLRAGNKKKKKKTSEVLVCLRAGKFDYFIFPTITALPLWLEVYTDDVDFLYHPPSINWFYKYEDD